MNHIVDAHVAYCKTISELDQDKSELRERIKRLEEAGDVLCAAAAFMGWHMEIENWYKAKEVKP